MVFFLVKCFKEMYSYKNSSSADQQQGEMAAVESGGGFSQKRNANSQVGYGTHPLEILPD